jgi:hypothetical protein
LGSPAQLALDAGGKIYVANYYFHAANFYKGTVTVYAAGAANNTKPINIIGGWERNYTNRKESRSA